MPTRAQAARVGMSNDRRLRMIRSAQSFAARSSTRGALSTVRRVGRARTTAREVPSLHTTRRRTR